MSKLTKLRNKLRENEVEALLVTSSINRRYISNFTGTAGAVIITSKEAILITDFRYTEQAKEQAENFVIIEHTGPIEEEIAEQLSKLHIKTLGFEEEHITYAQYKVYEKTFSPTLVAVKGIIEALRMIKTEEELQVMKQAAHIVDAAFEHILSFIKPGVKEIEVANELEFFMRKQGATSSSFDTIVASGLRSALPHGTASTKEIVEGELVTMDFGALFQGYCSDITRTVAVGEISEELSKIYYTVLEAQERGIREIKPNMTGKEADKITRDYIESKGYGKYFGHSTGHGLGLEVHEGPSLSPRSSTILEKNMVVTVEPGIYVPGVGGCRIEDDIVITSTGNERLTTSSKELIHI